MILKEMILLSSILGLFKLKFRRILLKDETKGNLYIITAVLFLIFSLSFFFIAIFALITSSITPSPSPYIDDTYPSGALYSTVRIKDFKTKK